MNGSEGFFIVPHGGKNVVWNPPWDNPNKFPRSEPLGADDDEAILRIVEIEKQLATNRRLREELVALREQMQIVEADIEAHKARLFPMLRKNHPSVVVSEGYGYGWRKFEDKYFVVAWDEATLMKFQKEQHDREHHGEPGEEPGSDA